MSYSLKNILKLKCFVFYMNHMCFEKVNFCPYRNTYFELQKYNMNDVCRFSKDHVVECAERTVLSCLEPVCLCWRC